MSSTIEIDFAGHRFVLDAGLALYWPEKDALVVSDLHLEKASFLAQFGSAVAPYDTLDTLSRLETLVTKYKPKSLILLGDSFHDRHAWDRQENTARQQLLSICSSVKACHLVEGNHDVGLLTNKRLLFSHDIELGGVIFQHEPVDSSFPQVVGHFHPKLRVRVRGHRLTGKVFAVNSKLLIMPAFGTFTGGLDISDGIFSTLAQSDAFRKYLVFRNTIVVAPKPGS